MNKNIQVFSSHEFGELNVLNKDGKQYFEGIKVAKILGYKNPRDAVFRHCKKEGVVFHDVGVSSIKKSDNSEFTQVATKKFIDEGNLYRLIIRSKLDSAKRFESFIMDEVMVSIRKHGAYISDDILDRVNLDEDNKSEAYIKSLLSDLLDERNKRVLIEERANDLREIIESDKSYTNIGKMIASTSDSITIGQFAKVLQNNNIRIGRNNLYEFLREDGYLIKNGDDKNMPKQIYINQGLFKVSERAYRENRRIILSLKTLVTSKGQKHFIDLFNEFKKDMYQS